MAVDNGRKPIALGGHARKVVGKFLEIQLFLVSEFQNRTVRV